MDLTAISRVEIIRGGRSGRSDYGRLYYLKNGKIMYLAKRNFEKVRKKRDARVRASDVYRGGLKDKSAAFREGKAEFALDDETLLKLRVMGCTVVGVCDDASGDIYLTNIEHFFDPDFYTYHDYTARGGAPQRFVNRLLFKATSGVKELLPKNIDKRFNLKGKRTAP